VARNDNLYVQLVPFITKAINTVKNVLQGTIVVQVLLQNNVLRDIFVLRMILPDNQTLAGTECEVGMYCPKGNLIALYCPFETQSYATRAM